MIPPQLLVHEATIEPYEGDGAYGPVFGAEFTVPCYYEERRRLVRASDGSEVVAEGTVFIDIPDTHVLTDSRVHVNGRHATVIATSLLDDRGITGLAHMELALA